MNETDEQTTLGPWLTNTFGDRYLYEVNRNALNREGAQLLHQVRFGDLFLKDNCLILVIGTDSGTLLHHLAGLEIAASTRIICFEPPELLERIHEEFPPERLPEQVLCRSYGDFHAMAEEYGFKEYFYIDAVQLSLSLAAQDAHLAGYQEVFWQLQVDVYQYMWEMRAALGSEDFIVRQLENLGENMLPARRLRGSFPGATAVLLAGGPSLDEAIPWVMAHRDEVVVLAVSRCARRLLEVGLLPDLVFSIDPHPISFDVSKEMLQLHEASLFVHMYHVSPMLLGQWRGRALYLGELFPWDSAHNEESLPTPGPTVSNVALAAAVEMGFAQIILAGVDLCHSREGFTHAKGSNEREAGPQLGRLCTQVETNGGWQAESTSDFATGIATLAMQAQAATGFGVRLINPAAGAARVAGIDHLPLEGLPLQPPQRPVAEVLAELAPRPERTARLAHLQAMREELTTMYGQLVQVNQLCAEALRCIDALFGRRGHQRHFQHKQRLDKIEKTLNRRHAKATRLIKTCGIRDFLRLTRVNPDAEWDEEEMERTSRAYYEAYRTSTRRIIELVSRSRDRLVSRMNEEAAEPELEALARQWRGDMQPGRVLLWQDRHSAYAPRPGQQDLVAALEREYLEMLASKDTGHMRRSREFASLDSIRAKAQMLLRQENREGLEQLQQALQRHPDPVAADLLELVSGYQHELAGEPAAALARYEQLFTSSDENVLEDALRRIASVCIGRGDLANAQLALETLGHLSPSYLVLLAELCWLGGNRQQAVHTLLNYLDQVPADHAAMIRLAKYYRDMGMEDGAQEILQHVLEQAPDNAMAKALLTQPLSSAAR